jgi:photosystem II 13kDa protein|uniref:Photosystem II reaction center Psb28 protein n=1 Tax=Vaucheria litorea TaxID=109269 RepID=B7T1U3_VAULI|nr:photosystem II protein W [Vaucheria litorea]ACF70909.1 photosystem II protein [Vaucheria litorea]
MGAKIQFIQGINEINIPRVKLTRSQNGTTGTATFLFTNSSLFNNESSKQGEITGMFLIDNEGILTTKDVNVRFKNGQPINIEALYIMTNPTNWDRFMRFMERYAKENGLTFIKK